MSVCLLLATVAWLSRYNGLAIVTKEIKENGIDAAYTQDYKNTYAELVKNSDYVFVATVEKNVGTRYTDENTFVDSENETHQVYNIFTQYQDAISKEIKGSLDETIVVEKLGGVDKELSVVHVIENDVMPQEGGEYIFL